MKAAPKDTGAATLDAGLIARKGQAKPGAAIEKPAAPKPRPRGARTAAVTFRVTARDFLRLKLASATLEASAQDVIIAALNDYLDRHGVPSADKCGCLRQTAMRLENRTPPRGA